MSAVAAQLNALIGGDCTYINNEYTACPHRHFRYQQVNKDGTNVNICFVDIPKAIDTHSIDAVKLFALHPNAFLFVPKEMCIPHIDGLSLTVYNPTTDSATETRISDLLYKQTNATLLKLIRNGRKAAALTRAQHAISRINALCSLCPLSVEVVYTHPIADVIKADGRIRVFIRNTQSKSYIPIFVAFALALMCKV